MIKLDAIMDMKTHANLEPSRTFTIDLFCKKNPAKLLTIAEKSPIADVRIGSKYVSRRINRNIKNIRGRRRGREYFGKGLCKNVVKSEIPWVAPFSESNIYNSHSP